METKTIIIWERVTLIKSVLNSIPIYFSFSRTPNNILDKLVWIRRRFLWGGDMEQKNIVWVKWASVCLPKEKEGIEIRDLRKFN